MNFMCKCIIYFAFPSFNKQIHNLILYLRDEGKSRSLLSKFTRLGLRMRQQTDFSEFSKHSKICIQLRYKMMELKELDDI